MTSNLELALSAPKSANVCNGKGLIWVTPHWDSGHPDYSYACGGCVNCASVGYAVSRFIFLASQVSGLSGFAALAAVGKVVRAALSPGLAVSTFLSDTVAVWNGEPVKGAWYLISGSRGNAKAHKGTVGECVWVGGNTTFRYGRATGYTARVGIKPVNSSEAVFVPSSCVTRVAPPTEALPAIAAKEAAVAERAARKPHAATKGDVVTVTHGASAGKTGRVFWVGSGKSGARFGLDPVLNRKTGRCSEPLWVDAVDCGPAAAPVSPAPAPVAVAVAVAPAPAPTPTAGHKHTKYDGSYWVNDAKGVPVARVCNDCKASKLAKYRPELVAA